MILTLEVSAPQAAELGEASRRIFREDGGTIGRANDCHWVLPHGKVSGRHALISYADGVFYIEDASRNGICLNSPENRLVVGRPYPLTSGDRILIDPYDIQVTIGAERREPPRHQYDEVREAPLLDAPFGGSHPFGADDPFAHDHIAPERSHQDPMDSMSGQELDPLKLLGPTPKAAPPRKARTAQDLELSSPLEGHYQPPAVRPAPVSRPPVGEGLIPQDYDPLAPEEPSAILPVPSPLPPPPRTPEVAVPTPSAIRKRRLPAAPLPASASTGAIAPPVAVRAAPVPAQETPSVASSGETGDPDLAALLAGAGLDRAALGPELARTFGQILRVVVAGVMDVLRSRQQIKDEFRMGITQFQPKENNPLKFSANVEDALHNLLVKRNAAFLGPVEAFEDAFKDLRNHQIAMLAGMRTAFESMLAEFDPDRLQAQFDRHLKRGPLLGAMAKLHYWDLYRERRDDMMKDPEASFRKLFGEEFTRAYEEQLRRLKAQGHAGKGPTKESEHSKI